jgi:catechol 2,3-dioxygenase-like lactoylglutathione lyase family enzyme
MTVEKISAVTFRVRNMKASVQFYREVLGMELLHGGEGNGFSSLRPKDTQSAILNLELGRCNWLGADDPVRRGRGCTLEAFDRLGLRAGETA